jgi:hypothetical protein
MVTFFRLFDHAVFVIDVVSAYERIEYRVAFHAAKLGQVIVVPEPFDDGGPGEYALPVFFQRMYIAFAFVDMVLNSVFTFIFIQPVVIRGKLFPFDPLNRGYFSGKPHSRNKAFNERDSPFRVRIIAKYDFIFRNPGFRVKRLAVNITQFRLQSFPVCFPLIQVFFQICVAIAYRFFCFAFKEEINYTRQLRPICDITHKH